jgi:hypothetical protein
MTGRHLTQNSELRRIGVWNWTLPAFVVTLSNGRRFNACPNAGPCARVCYARFGTYQFGNVRARHLANLERVLDDPTGWHDEVIAELDRPAFRKPRDRSTLDHDRSDEWLTQWVGRGGAAVRVHDAGDFFAQWYLDLWLSIASSHPSVLFYAYTKEVQMILENENRLPPNFRVIFSYGGLQDHLIDPDRHRHAEVFPDVAQLSASGYTDQSESDLIAICAPATRIGITANNLSVPKRRFAGRTMSALQNTTPTTRPDPSTPVQVTRT